MLGETRFSGTLSGLNLFQAARVVFLLKNLVSKGKKVLKSGIFVLLLNPWFLVRMDINVEKPGFLRGFRIGNGFKQPG